MKGMILLAAALLGAQAAPGAVTLFSETFSSGAYDNAGWTTWHAPWGNNPTVSLAGDAAAINAGGNGSAGIAFLIDISSVNGMPITLEGEWSGSATGTAWVEVLFFQTNDTDMTDLSSANFTVFDGGAASVIAVKHDSFGLPDTTWGLESFASDATNNGAAAGFTAGLTQVASMDYAVLAFKTGNDGAINTLDNVRITAVPEPGLLPLLAFGATVLLRRRRNR